MNQQTGEDLDPRNREGRFPKGGGKQKKQKTEAACQEIQKCDCGFRMEISSVAQVYKIILYIYIHLSVHGSSPVASSRLDRYILPVKIWTTCITVFLA